MKKDVIKELKKENDHRNVRAIQAEIHDQQNKSRKAMIRRTELLYYLERTSRFREIKEYEKVSFRIYIQHEYNLLPGTYERERRAVFGYRKQVEDYGVGLVAKVLDVTKKPEKVFKSINGLAKDGKRPANFRAKTEEIIEQNRKLHKPKVIIPKLCHECEKFKAEIRELRKELNQKDEQIAKLKAALNKRDLALEQMNGLLKPFEHIVQAVVQ